MKEEKNSYQFFGKFILRAPILSLNFFFELVGKDDIENKVLLEAYKKPLIKEAIFLAAPSLYFEMEKWLKGEQAEININKLRISFLKYLTRMSTRCTPFGLFAGYTLGKIDNKTDIFIGEKLKHQRFTSPDMDYLIQLADKISEKKEIRDQLKFHPNSSLYKYGDKLRYIEYDYKNRKREHKIVEIDNSVYLEKLLKRALQGAFISDLQKVLSDKEINFSVANDFIHELIENQILVGELQPTLTGVPLLEYFTDTLKFKNEVNFEVGILEKLKMDLEKVDKKIGNNPQTYLNIIEGMKKFSLDLKMEYLFQTDLEMNTKSCSLSKNTVEKVKEVMGLMNKMTVNSSVSSLDKFKNKFIQRYDRQEMPIAQVLDVDTGIGYLDGYLNDQDNPFIADINLPSKKNHLEFIQLNWNEIHRKLADKVIEAMKRDNKTIYIEDSDFENLSPNWQDLPDTITTMIQIFYENGKEKIKLSPFSGSSAANWLSRFSQNGKEIQHYVEEITSTEMKMNPSKILAEIIHLPESRIGNVLKRSEIRKFEIPYLGQSALDLEKQIPIQDLFICVRKNKIILRSKKYDREVIPYLTNAHNYEKNSLPLYHFLCDMQSQNIRKRINFSYGPLNSIFKFLPRVEYKNIVLQEAVWFFNFTDFESLLENRKSPNKLKLEIKKFLEKWEMPYLLLFCESDNELLINFENLSSVIMLLDCIKDKKNFILKEFLFEEGTPVKSCNGSFANQLLISFYNKSKLIS